jgi:hypothetical protein
MSLIEMLNAQRVFAGVGHPVAEMSDRSRITKGFRLMMGAAAFASSQ